MAIRNDLGIDGQVPMAVEAAYAGILPPAPLAAPNDPANVRQVAQNTASTPPVVITIALEDGNVARLPADTDISNVRANGADLEFVQPDGTVIVVPGGSIASLVLFVGDIQIPAETVELMFETAGIEPAAGPAGGADGAHGGYEDLGPQSVGDGFRQNSLLGDTGLPGAGAQGGDQVAGNTVPKFPAGGIIVTLSEEGLKDANGNDIGNRDGIGIPDDQSDVPQVLNIGFGLVDGEGNDLSYSMLGLPSVNWTSGGNLITWALNAAGTELVGSTIDGEAIVVSFDNTTDSYTVTLLKPLDHPNKAGEDRLELALDIRVRDYQNWNDGKLILRIEDDSPEETANTIRKGQANEDDLDNGIWIPFLGVFGSNGTSPDYLPENNHDGDTSYTGLFGTVPVWGNLRPLISAGADGYGDNGFHIVDDDAALDAWVDQADLASKKSEITTWQSILTANGEAIGFFAADGRLVFGLYVEPDGTYNFRLFDQLDHAKPLLGTAVEDVIGLDLSGLIAFTDGDGDTKILSADRVVIDIIDDIPRARGFELAVVNEDDLANFNPAALLGILDFWQGSFGTSPYDGPDDGSITGLLGTVPTWGFLGDNIVGGADESGHFDLVDEERANEILDTLGPNNPNGMDAIYSNGCPIDLAKSIEIPGIGTAMGFFADGRLVMGLFVDDTGLYNFRLFDQIDHIRYDAQGNEIPVGRLFLDMGEFVTYTDADGDTIDLGGHFKVKVIDDHPLVTCDKIEFTLDEARLDNFNVITAGIQILDALGVTHDLFLELPAWLRVVGSDGTEGSLPSGQGGIGDHLLGTVSKSGFLNDLVVGGADEFGRFDVKAFASDADLQAALKSLGGGDYLTSNGEAINNVRTFDLEIGGLDLGTVMGFFSDDGRLIFTVSVSTALGIGAYDIRLFDQMDHFESRQQGEEIKLDLGEFITYTDADLDQVDFGGHITLTVKDDEPDLKDTVSTNVDESDLSNFNLINAGVLALTPAAFLALPGYLSVVGSEGSDQTPSGLLDTVLGTASQSGFLNTLVGHNVVVGGADEFGKFELVTASQAASILDGLDLSSNHKAINHVEILDLGIVHPSLGSLMGFFAEDGRLIFTLTVTEFGAYDIRLFDQIDHGDPGTLTDHALTIALGKFVTYTDADNDSIFLDDHFTVTIADDEPSLDDAIEVVADEANLSSAVKFLGVVIAGSDGTLQLSDDAIDQLLGTVGQTGLLYTIVGENVVATGADEFGHFELLTGDALTDAIEALGLTSKGSPVESGFIQSVPPLGDVLVITSADGRPILSLSVNELGVYDVRLFDQIDHLDNGVNLESLSIALGGLIDYVDADGDRINLGANFTLRVVDDTAEIDLEPINGAQVVLALSTIDTDPLANVVPIAYGTIAGAGTLFTATTVHGADELPATLFPPNAAPVEVSYALKLVPSAATGLLDPSESGANQQVTLEMSGTSVIGRNGAGDVVLLVSINADTGAVQTWQYRPLEDADGQATAEMLEGALLIEGTITDFDGSTHSDTVELGSKLSYNDSVPDIIDIEDRSVAMDWANQTVAGDIFVNYGGDGPAVGTPIKITGLPPLGPDWVAEYFNDDTEVRVYTAAPKAPGDLLYTLKVVASEGADGDSDGDADDSGYIFTLHKPWPAVPGQSISITDFGSGGPNNYPYATPLGSVTFNGINPNGGTFGVGTSPALSFFSGDEIENNESFDVDFPASMSTATLALTALTLTGTVTVTWTATGPQGTHSEEVIYDTGGGKTLAITPPIEFTNLAFSVATSTATGIQGARHIIVESLTATSAPIPADDQPLNFQFTAYDDDGDWDTHTVTISLDNEAIPTPPNGEIWVFNTNNDFVASYTTLASAIAASSTQAGFTVKMGAGEFAHSGQLNINKSLKFEGADFGETVIKRTGAAGGTEDRTVEVQANDVSFKNLTFAGWTNPTTPSNAGRGYLVWVDNRDNVTFDDVKFDGDNIRVALFVREADGLDLINSTFAGEYYRAAVRGSGANLNISDNVFNTAHYENGPISLEYAHPTSGVISGNEFNHSYGVTVLSADASGEFKSDGTLAYTIGLLNPGSITGIGLVIENNQFNFVNADNANDTTGAYPSPTAVYSAVGTPAGMLSILNNDFTGYESQAVSTVPHLVAGRSGAGQALSFDGNEGYATFELPVDIGSSGTLSVWVTLDTLTKRNMVLEGPHNGGLEFQYRNNANGQFYISPNGSNGNNYAIMNGNASAFAGDWVNVQYTWHYPTKTLAIYINGVAVSYLSGFDETAGNWQTVVDTIGGLFFLGRDPGESDDERARLFDGEMDDLAIFSTVLDQTQRDEVRTSASTLDWSTYSSLVAYWNFDSVNGNRVESAAGLDIDIDLKSTRDAAVIEVNGAEGHSTRILGNSTDTTGSIVDGTGSELIGGSGGDDFLDGGAGIDLLDLSRATAGVSFVLAQSGTDTVVDLSAVGLGNDTYRNFEGVLGSSFADELHGSSAADILIGGGGDDVLVGGAGADALRGDAGADHFTLTDASAIDYIADYDIGEGDVVDISALLDDVLGGTNVTGAQDFVRISPTGSMSVDANGAVGGENFVEVARLAGSPSLVTVVLDDDVTLNIPSI